MFNHSIRQPLFLSAADLAFGKPFVHGDARESRQLAGEFHMRQPAREQVVNCAHGHAEACGKLSFGFVFGRSWLRSAIFCILIFAHITLFARNELACVMRTLESEWCGCEKSRTGQIGQKPGGTLKIFSKPRARAEEGRGQDAVAPGSSVPGG
jgi:hypothetical protein